MWRKKSSHQPQIALTNHQHISSELRILKKESLLGKLVIHFVRKIQTAYFGVFKNHQMINWMVDYAIFFPKKKTLMRSMVFMCLATKIVHKNWKLNNFGVQMSKSWQLILFLYLELWWVDTNYVNCLDIYRQNP